ncbi:MAG: orotate phosphoribosyltransferase [Ezakiella sp.]|nr:orotate phosphoribosyltransferase [Ezakiella sp.]MDD7471489.1 orotate phosphoribosyltransferase [Bacillota bacterium]MDY3923691.1 orotate phosphoribosyltransferase [Ezakiella sp.]
MSEREVSEILRKREALLHGHFGLSSGKHSNVYMQCALATEYAEDAEVIANAIKAKLEENNIHPDVVVGPAMGGIIIGYELARSLKVRSIFAERKDGEMCLRRGFKIEKGEKVLICEDVVTTGKSSLETAKVIEEQGGIVIGIAAIVDRSKDDTPIPVYSAYKLEAEIYEPEDCPLCKENVPINKPGSRFLKK